MTKKDKNTSSVRLRKGKSGADQRNSDVAEDQKKEITEESQKKVGWYTRWRREKELERFYEQQKELDEMYEKDRRLMSGEDEPEEMERDTDRLLARLRFMLTIGLLFTNFACSFMSGSLSIVSTFIDSLMDITSSLIIGGCLMLISNTNSFNYPRGRARLELVGVIACSVIMGIANTGVILQSINQIINGNSEPEMNGTVLTIMLGGSLIKGILMVACYKRGSSSSTVLAMDMRNDIATTLVAITCAFIGYRYWPYADPVGAICVCGLIALNWFSHVAEHLPLLVGVRAQRENISRILKITLDHDPRIRYIDHVMVYHTGLEAIVELHIVMDENLPLKVTHDISHPLEKKLMKLDFVERAFVHCDYDCDGD